MQRLRTFADKTQINCEHLVDLAKQSRRARAFLCSSYPSPLDKASPHLQELSVSYCKIKIILLDKSVKMGYNYLWLTIDDRGG